MEMLGENLCWGCCCLAWSPSTALHSWDELLQWLCCDINSVISYCIIQDQRDRLQAALSKAWLPSPIPRWYWAGWSYQHQQPSPMWFSSKVWVLSCTCSLCLDNVARGFICWKCYRVKVHIHISIYQVRYPSWQTVHYFHWNSRGTYTVCSACMGTAFKYGADW